MSASPRTSRAPRVLCEPRTRSPLVGRAGWAGLVLAGLLALTGCGDSPTDITQKDTTVEDVAAAEATEHSDAGPEGSVPAEPGAPNSATNAADNTTDNTANTADQPTSGATHPDDGAATQQPIEHEKVTAEDLTAPGTTVDLGEEALVEYTDHEENTSIFALTVESIEPGEYEDLVGLGVTSAEGMIPYYVQVTATFLDGDSPISTADLQGAITGITDDGAPGSTVVLVGDFEPCPTDMPTTWQVGETGNFCRMVAHTERTPVSGVHYAPNRFNNNPFTSNPIVWN